MPAGSLTTYRKKRDFEKTAEPSGRGKVASSKERRFVIQKHAATRLHYDLRLEFDGVFKSWAVTRGPSLDPHDKRLAVEVEDHPLDYGDFEGTIPKGQYGGGTVQLWDRGTWHSDDPEKGFKKGDLKFTLDGDKLHGSWVLVRMRHDRNGGGRTNWLLIKHRDEFAKEGEDNNILDEDRSVASGRSMEEIAEGKGRAPKPFMTVKSGRAKADAVWHSNRGEAAEARAANGKGIGRRCEGEAGRGQGERQESRRDAGFRGAAALRFGRPSAQRRRLVPRDQVRRLSRAIAGRGRRGGAQDPQGAGLDRQISGNRERRQRAAGHADRRRDRGARPRWRAGFLDAAGGDFRRQDRSSDLLCVRSAVCRRRGSAPRAARRSQGAVEADAGGTDQRQGKGSGNVDPLCRTFRKRRRCHPAIGLQAGTGRHRFQEAQRSLSVRPLRQLDQGQMPRRAGSRARRLENHQRQIPFADGGHLSWRAPCLCRHRRHGIWPGHRFVASCRR